MAAQPDTEDEVSVRNEDERRRQNRKTRLKWDRGGRTVTERRVR